MKKGLWLSVLLLFFSSMIFAASYKVDSSHSDIGFSIKHLGISNVRGQFKDVSGTINWDGEKNLKDASIKGTVKVDSVDTQEPKRDEHLKSPDFFDAATYPEMTFKSTKIYKKRRSLYADGELTIHGVTREVTIPLTIEGPITDPWGNTKIGASTQFVIDRKDYGLTWNKTLDKGGLVVGDDVTITLSVEAGK